MTASSQKKKYIYRFILTVILAFLWFCVLNLLNSVIKWMFAGFDRLMLWIFMQWCLPIYIMTAIKRDGIEFRELGFESDKKFRQVCLGILAGVAMFVLQLAVREIMGQVDLADEWPLAAERVKDNAGYILFNMVYNVFGVAVNEELFFRGYLMALLRKNLLCSDLAAIVINSLIFGAFHIVNLSLFNICNAVALGMIFALLKTKIQGFTMVSLVLTHGIFNTFAMVI